MILLLNKMSFKPTFLILSFTLIKKLFSSSFLSVIREVSSIHPKLLMFLPPILIPACNSSSPAFLIMCSAYSLNKQGDGRHSSHIPFSILNQSVVPYKVSDNCCFLTCIQFSRVRWSGIPISLRAFHSLS